MQRKSLANATCPVARSLDVVGDWWSLRLRKLEENGILLVMPASDGSAYQEYVLTAKGKALRPVIKALWNWGAEYMFTVMDRPTRVQPLTFAR